jgi:hypothetical protein
MQSVNVAGISLFAGMAIGRNQVSQPHTLNP